MTSALGVVQTWISTTVGQRVMHGLRTDVFAHLQRQSIAFFTRTRGGEVQSRITNDIGGMQSVVTSTATSIASNLTTAVATAVAMVALSWRLSLLSLVVLPPADLADPPGRADAPRRSPRSSSASWPTCNVTDRGGPVGQRRPARPRPSAPGPRWSTRFTGTSDAPRSTSSCAPSSPAAGGWRR